METVATQYVTKLAEYLNAQLVNHPIPGVTGGLIHIGRYQDDPTEHTFIATVHEGGPMNVTKTGHQSWKHEINNDFPEEMSGGEPCSSYWTYRFNIKIDFYMVDTGEDQTEARQRGMLVAQWFRYWVHLATPSEIGMSQSDYNEIALSTKPVAIEMIEGGGPGSYIEKALLYIEMITYLG